MVVLTSLQSMYKCELKIEQTRLTLSKKAVPDSIGPNQLSTLENRSIVTTGSSEPTL